MKFGRVIQYVTSIAFFVSAFAGTLIVALTLITLIIAKPETSLVWYTAISIFFSLVSILFYINCGIAGIKQNRNALAYGIFLLAINVCRLIFDVCSLFEAKGVVAFGSEKVVNFISIGIGFLFVGFYIFGAYLVRDKEDEY